MISMFWSPLLLSVLIQIALILPNGSNAAYDNVNGLISKKVVLDVTHIFTNMPDNLANERGNLQVLFVFYLAMKPFF